MLSLFVKNGRFLHGFGFGFQFCDDYGPFLHGLGQYLLTFG